MWSKIEWLANLKFVIEIILAIATVAIAFFSWQVYQNQLKVMEYQNLPKFRIIVSTESVDNTYEKYIQVNNLGEPIETNIDTHAIMKVQMQEESDSKEINILLDGYFYKTDDMVKNGTSMMGVVCRRGTNFCAAYMSAAVVSARLKLNEEYDSRKIQIYENVYHLVKITYPDYKDQEVSRYFYVGEFENNEISESEYKKLLNTQYKLNVSDYLNSPPDDELMEILIENLN